MITSIGKKLNNNFESQFYPSVMTKEIFVNYNMYYGSYENSSFICQHIKCSKNSLH